MWTCENRRTSNSARRPPFSLCCVILLIGSTTALTQTPTPRRRVPGSASCSKAEALSD